LIVDLILTGLERRKLSSLPLVLHRRDGREVRLVLSRSDGRQAFVVWRIPDDLLRLSVGYPVASMASGRGLTGG
jgi:hypothetical protein